MSKSNMTNFSMIAEIELQYGHDTDFSGCMDNGPHVCFV